jgi:hypothetical protein
VLSRCDSKCEFGFYRKGLSTKPWQRVQEEHECPALAVGHQPVYNAARRCFLA